MSRRSIAPLILAALLRAAPAQADAECRPPPAKARLRVSLQPDTSLREVAAWVATLLCKPVVYGAGVDAAARLTLVAPHALSPAAAYRLFVDALTAIDLRAIRGQQSIIIKPSAACAGFAQRNAAGPRPAAGRTAAPPELDRRALARGIRRRSPTEHELRRDVLDAVLSDSRWLMRSVRIVPDFRDGKPRGFRLYAIRRGSFWDLAGLQNGDTVHAVNGLPLSSPEQALSAYSAIRAAQEITLRITRRGNPLALRYRVRP